MFLPTVLLASFVAVPGPDLEIRAVIRILGGTGLRRLHYTVLFGYITKWQDPVHMCNRVNRKVSAT